MKIYVKDLLSKGVRVVLSILSRVLRRGRENFCVGCVSVALLCTKKKEEEYTLVHNPPRQKKISKSTCILIQFSILTHTSKKICRVLLCKKVEYVIKTPFWVCPCLCMYVGRRLWAYLTRILDTKRWVLSG